MCFPNIPPCVSGRLCLGHVRWEQHVPRVVGTTFPGTQQITLSTLGPYPGDNELGTSHFRIVFWPPANMTSALFRVIDRSMEGQQRLQFGKTLAMF
jgi:hypothetical protein